MRMKKAVALEISVGRYLKKSPLPSAMSILWLLFQTELVKVFFFFLI